MRSCTLQDGGTFHRRARNTLGAKRFINVCVWSSRLIHQKLTHSPSPTLLCINIYICHMYIFRNIGFLSNIHINTHIHTLTHKVNLTRFPDKHSISLSIPTAIQPIRYHRLIGLDFFLPRRIIQ